MDKPDEAVLAQYVAEVKERERDGKERFAAIDAVLALRLPKNTATEDRIMIKSAVIDLLLEQEGVQNRFRAISPSATLLGGGRWVSPKRRDERRDWLTDTEERHESIHSEFPQPNKGVA